MQQGDRSTIPQCQFLDCISEAQPYGYEDKYWDCCEYHREGGIFGTGESYEHYQIIEQDFIDFIKMVPLSEEHFSVHSPVLRDILIRTCVQIEIFFKEWSKQVCSEERSGPLWERYNEKDKTGVAKGIRNWTFKDYYFFKKKFTKRDSIHVFPLQKSILPFKGWSDKKDSLLWWKVYNGIKHGGHSLHKEYDLETTLYALAALFLMHCSNHHSRMYLASFNYGTIVIDGLDKVLVKTRDLSTPMDSKKYLFRADHSVSSHEVHLMTIDHLRKHRGFR